MAVRDLIEALVLLVALGFAVVIATRWSESVRRRLEGLIR